MKKLSAIAKKLWAKKLLRLSLLFFTLTAVYILFIRPFLLRDMRTVTFELCVFAVLLGILLVSLLILIAELLLALFTAVLRRKRGRAAIYLTKSKAQATVSAVFALFTAAIVILSQVLAYTPPILDSDGNKLPNSIAVLEKVEINGSREWISIRGNDRDNPVLLFLAGGPGGSQMAAVRDQLQRLEESFVVVVWDQPGSAKSYNAVPQKELTLDRYIDDGCSLASYLCQRFDKEKIYLVGESWGSALGILMAQQTPQLFYAFAGTGQMVSFLDTELYCYHLAMETAKNAGDQKTVQKLEKQGEPPYYGKRVALQMASYLMYLFQVMNSNPAIAQSSHNTFTDLAGPEYGLYDKLTYILGLTTTLTTVYQQLYPVDLRQQAAKIEIPVYFFEGRHDINAPTTLAEEYYTLLDAPYKELIWFEHSGHTPWVDQNELFADKLIQVFLANTKG